MTDLYESFLCNDNSPYDEPTQVKLDMSHDLIVHVLEGRLSLVAQKNEPHLGTQNESALTSGTL